MPSILLSEWVMIPSLGLLVFIASYFGSTPLLNFLHKKSLGRREYVLEKLDQMFVETDRQKVTMAMLLMSFGLGGLVFLLLWPNFFAGFLLGSIFTVAGWSLPQILVDQLYKRRCAKLADQMVDSLTIMANGIRSGLSIPQSMERVVENMGNPISQEFNLVLSQTRVGLSVEEALNQLAVRIPQSDVQMFVLSINILKETGGNLGETFTTIVETIRERQKIEKKIEALTAQGVTQGIIISSVPFFLMIMFLLTDPNYIKPLFNTTLGIIFLMVMLVLQVMGGLMIRNIVKIKV